METICPNFTEEFLAGEVGESFMANLLQLLQLIGGVSLSQEAGRSDSELSIQLKLRLEPLDLLKQVIKSLTRLTPSGIQNSMDSNLKNQGIL